MNTPVSFKLAKLLKEKGFDEPTSKYFRYDGKECENKPLNWNEDVGFFSRPSIAEIVMWLYDKYGIWIEVVKPVRQKLFRFNVDNKDDINEFTSVVCFNSPTEAYEAAIEYCLTKLI